MDLLLIRHLHKRSLMRLSAVCTALSGLGFMLTADKQIDHVIYASALQDLVIIICISSRLKKNVKSSLWCAGSLPSITGFRVYAASVGNVPYNMGEDQLIDVFKSVGQVIGFRYCCYLDSSRLLSILAELVMPLNID